MSTEWVAVAHLIRPQGRKGELLAELLTDFPESLVDRPRLFLAKEGFSGTAEEARTCRVTDCWLPKGRNEGRAVVALAGVGTISDAEAVAGFDVLVEAGDRLPLEDGAAYISDLVGCSVMDGEHVVGVVEAVEFPTSPDGRRRLEEATPILQVLLPGGGEAMVPFTRVFLREIDVAGKVLRMELPEGLVGDGETGDAGEPEPESEEG